MKKICRVEHLGLVPYKAAWDYQNELAAKIATSQLADTLLLLEHPHIYTLGRRGSMDNLVWSELEMKKHQVTTIEVDRGGDITYHGPGQLVGYPLMRLASIGWQGDRLPEVDYVGYLRKLEEVLICALTEFGVKGFRIEGKTGVWVGGSVDLEPQKIASIGVKIDSQGISRHGFALNVNPEMEYWQGIVPCGLKAVTMTSLSNICQEEVKVSQVIRAVESCFAHVFDRKLVIGESLFRI